MWEAAWDAALAATDADRLAAARAEEFRGGGDGAYSAWLRASPLYQALRGAAHCHALTQKFCTAGGKRGLGAGVCLCAGGGGETKI